MHRRSMVRATCLYTRGRQSRTDNESIAVPDDHFALPLHFEDSRDEMRQRQEDTPPNVRGRVLYLTRPTAH